ncbi:MAG: cytochrome c [Acidimicrobiales bacterium]|nr:cytochrome c [Acidimicrobiales bacterium]MCB9392070.1 cytochrome c [Acidimicrobiaceae bacterium]
MLAASTTAIGWVIFTIITLGWVVYFFGNRRASRPELGSEIELAPNRKPYYDDETLEGPRLERVQLFGVLLLALIVVALPLYWVFEPSRQAGAQSGKESRFVGWGSQLYATTEEGGFNCAGCHGASGGGGVAPYSISDPNTGEVTAVTWTAPAINTIFYRYDESEVKFILVYGRPFSPMSPWGLAGGGPMNDQQIDTLISKLWSLQIPREGCPDGDPNCDVGVLPQAEQDRIAADAQVAAQALVDAGEYATVDEAMGEALFNLNTSSGAYSCARCHTQGWSWGDPGVPGQGAFGWNLTGGSAAKHFPNQGDMETFIANGSEYGKRYGVQGQGSGRMPGFGTMLTEEQIEAVVEYVRSL